MTRARKASPAKYARHVIRLKTVKRCPIIFGYGIINELERYFDFSGYSDIVLITDRTVKRLHGQRVFQILKPTGKKVFLFTLSVGERAKSLSTVERGYRFLLENNIDRKGLICTLGGGVVGDTGGYIAATYLRGIDYIQLPTTLLAQVDSSIGGKVGVNFGGKKNMLGSFYQPRGIIGDVAFLQSLPAAEMQNGMAEVIKYALAMDEGLFHILDRKRKDELTTAELTHIVRRCGYLKASIVEVDETERGGQRAVLNFGHTVGHALEATTKLRRLSHGEAVAIGIIAAARISEQVGMLDRSNLHKIENVLLKSGLPTSCQGTNPDDLLDAIRFDKKTTFGQTGWVLLKDIGEGMVNQPVAESIVRGVLKEICR
jgi:3-dehydroquinate synthase